MIIEDNLLAVCNAMLRDKQNWKFVTDKQKETFFFIINRRMSQKYPEKSQLLNLKAIDKVSALDLWYYFMLDKTYPKWFWAKTESKTDKSDISEKEFNLLLNKLHINKKEDLEYLIDNHIDFIKGEIKYFKSLEK